MIQKVALTVALLVCLYLLFLGPRRLGDVVWISFVWVLGGLVAGWAMDRTLPSTVLGAVCFGIAGATGTLSGSFTSAGRNLGRRSRRAGPILRGAGIVVWFSCGALLTWAFLPDAPAAAFALVVIAAVYLGVSLFTRWPTLRD